MSEHQPQLPRLEHAAKIIRAKTDLVPSVALVLGSGLGAYADTLEEKVVIPYSEIEGMPASKVQGHKGNLVFGKAGDTVAVAMQGRVHLYEGHPVEDIVFGLRLMIHLGAEKVLITNAAGGIRDDLNPGDLMLIEDQLNMTGQNPLVGPNEDALGVRFVDMTRPYDLEMRMLAAKEAEAQGFLLSSGVYCGLLGPTYETPAEIRAFRNLGADAIGMSTVLEVIAARHMSARVLGISCITNKAAGLGEETLTHEDVQVVAQRARTRFVGLVDSLVRKLG